MLDELYDLNKMYFGFPNNKNVHYKLICCSEGKNSHAGIGASLGSCHIPSLK